MPRPSTDLIDESMARFLVQPSSGNALSMIRQTRRFIVQNCKDGSDPADRAGTHLRNCTELHGAVLTLESDPEIVKRNVLARMISAIFPVMNAFEEIRSLREGRPLDLFMNGLSIISEITQATQYLEATKLTALANSERALVKVEERLIELALETSDDPGSEIANVEDFMDAVRTIELDPKDRPFVPFLLWTFISVISYKRLKDIL